MAKNRSVHFEIRASQPEALTKFHGALFGWTFDQSPFRPGGTDAAIVDPQGSFCGPWEHS